MTATATAKPKRIIHEYIEVTLKNGKIADLPVRLSPGECMHYMDYVIEQPKPDTVILGYFIQDDDAGNPLENCDGMGHIYSAHRFAPKGDNSAMQEALGLDSDWQPDWQSFYDQATDQLREANCDKAPDEREPTEEQIERKAKDLWSYSRNPHAVLLDCYEHSGQHWSLSGGGMQCQWDTARGAGVWVPDDSCLEHIVMTAKERGVAEYEIAVECAKQALEEFNAWLSGDVYGVIVVTCRRVGKDDWEMVESDEVWGHVGSKWAKQALQEEVDATVRCLVKPKKKGRK